MVSVIAVHVWRLMPLAAVIIMAGLAAIPKDLDEAARVDGAGFWRRMFEITIPLTMPVIAVAALFGAIFTFTDMAVVYVLTRGGPTNSTQVLRILGVLQGHRRWRRRAGRGDRAVPVPDPARRSRAHPARRTEGRGALMAIQTAATGLDIDHMRAKYRRKHVMGRITVYVLAIFAAFCCAAPVPLERHHGVQAQR